MQDLRYQQITAVQDETFDPARLSEYQLLLTLGQHDFKLAAIDLARHKVLLLEHYHLPHTYSLMQTGEKVQQLIGQHAFLTKGRWAQIRCGLYQPYFTMLPEALFQAGHEADYYRLACPFDEFHERVLVYSHDRLEAMMLYSANRYLLQCLDPLQSADQLQLRPVVSAFIEGLLHTQARQAVPQLFALVEGSQVLLVLLIDGEVRFCNAFPFTTPEDFIYFIVFAMQEHKLNPDQDVLTLWGELTPDSALFTVLRKYIRQVKLGRPPAELQYTYRLQDLLPHRYFDLFSLYFCD